VIETMTGRLEINDFLDVAFVMLEESFGQNE